MLSSRVMDNTFRCSLNRNLLREVTVKIKLKRIDIQKEITVEILLDSGVTGLVGKQEFKLKKIERPIYIRNVDRMFNKEGLIENTVEINIFYKKSREKTEIDFIGSQK